MSQESFRNNALNQTGNFLEVVQDGIKQSDSPEKLALQGYYSMLSRLNDTMKHAKNAEAFAQAVKGITEVMEKEFFSKVYGTKTEEPKEEKNDEPLFYMPNLTEEVSASAEEDVPFNIKAHIIGGDVDKLPVAMRSQLAKALKALGVPEQQINRELGL
jgi:hypothetical protein